MKISVIFHICCVVTMLVLTKVMAQYETCFDYGYGCDDGYCCIDVTVGASCVKKGTSEGEKCYKECGCIEGFSCKYGHCIEDCKATKNMADTNSDA